MPTTSGLSSHHIVLRALAALMLGLLLMGYAHAASIARPTDLREDRYLDAAVVARLKAGAQVDILAFEGDSHVEWFEGNYQAYEEDKKRRLGADAAQPKRIKYQPISR